MSARRTEPSVYLAGTKDQARLRHYTCAAATDVAKTIKREQRRLEALAKAADQTRQTALELAPAEADVVVPMARGRRAC